MAGIRIRLRKVDKGETNRRFDMEGLRDEKIKNCFSAQLENSWRQSKEKKMNTIEDMWRKIKDVYTETAQQVLGQAKRKKNKPWISREVLELSDKRRDTRKIRTHSEENMERYREITKEIRRKAKTCKEEWIEEKCREVEDIPGALNTGKLFQVAREVCGTINVRLATVRNKEGILLDSKPEIKQRWKQYYEGLYNDEIGAGGAARKQQTRADAGHTGGGNNSCR